jgi:hypothetical protein
MLSSTDSVAFVAIAATFRGEHLAGRPNNQVETRLVNEWLVATYPTSHWQTHVRLGSMPLGIATDNLDDQAAMLVHSRFARWADAIVALPDRTRLVEAKVVAHPNAIAQLIVYKRLMPFTPGLRIRTDVPIELVMLYARPDDVVLQVAAEMGITSVQYDPPWVDDYLRTLALRKQQAPQAQTISPAG